MALPQIPEARPFYRSAEQRFEDAQFLLDGGRTTGAIYLAGYSVECIMKALILASVPAGQRTATLGTFRGTLAHDFGWLKSVYRNSGGPALSAAVSRQFLVVNTWRTDLRYEGATVQRSEAEKFLGATEAILNWADGRL